MASQGLLSDLHSSLALSRNLQYSSFSLIIMGSVCHLKDLPAHILIYIHVAGNEVL